MDKEKIVSKIENELCIGSASSLLEFVFFDKKHAVKLPYETRALVKHKDGFIEIAVWLGEEGGWCDEGSYSNCGGIGGNITNDVSEFALNGCQYPPYVLSNSTDTLNTENTMKNENLSNNNQIKQQK
tara:strand:+ start:9879 stop:10259 length:381 start_codon:yes stop_codon:yes gene_type:complete